MALPELQAGECAVVADLHTLQDHGAGVIGARNEPPPERQGDSSLSAGPVLAVSGMGKSSGTRAPSPEWRAVAQGVEIRPLVEGEGNALVLYRIAPGLTFQVHRHDFPEYGTLVLGRGRLLLGDRTEELLEGDSYYVPSGASHGFESALQSGPVVILHVAVGHGRKLRTSILGYLQGQARSLVRPSGQPLPGLAARATPEGPRR